MTFRFALICTILACLLTFAGCRDEQPKSGETIERPGESPFSYVDEDDPDMTAAIHKARSTTQQFIRALTEPKPSQSGFSVKMLVTDSENDEHIWVSPVRHEDGRFVGNINNEPVSVTTIKLGDVVDAASGEISDWMYIENDTLVGGYTLRVLRGRLSEQEREVFDGSLPFRIE